MAGRVKSLWWGVPLALIAFIAVSDLFGWAYLRRPLQAVLSVALDREVVIGSPLRIHLRPTMPVRVGSLSIGAPEWSDAPHFIALDDVAAEVGWGVLLGRAPHLQRLAIGAVDVHAERDGEGRASWRLGKGDAPAQDAGGPALPVIDRLEIGRATIALSDAPTGLEVEAVASVHEGGSAGSGGRGGGEPAGLVATGKGRWKDDPLSFSLKTPRLPKGVEGAIEDVDLQVKLGRTEAGFSGRLELPAFAQVSGDVTLRGPSLAALTVIPDLVLPTTPPYELTGKVRRDGRTVEVAVSEAKIGSSRMTAQLAYEGEPVPPVLRGTIEASRLVLQDLGPSIGTTQKETAKGGARVLPAREFDLPRLRAMDADVRLDLRELDLGTQALRPLRSLRARLLLDGGVLKLEDLRSDLAGGTVGGTIVLDGSQPAQTTSLDAQLRWDRVDLKSWLQVSGGQLVAGRFSGRTDLAGNGRSTAAILGSLHGKVKGRIDGGSVSHQLVELAGLDAAQALGVYFSGDRPLALSCALMDLSAEKGTLRSNLFLLNTRDTLFFVQGTVGFRDEALDLRLVQSPKDWSPFSLRAPLRIRGTLGDPEIGVEAAPIALKVLSSLVLGAVAPIAALLPFIEPEDNAAREGCEPAIDQVRRKAAELREREGDPGGKDGKDGKSRKDGNDGGRGPRQPPV